MKIRVGKLSVNFAFALFVAGALLLNGISAWAQEPAQAENTKRSGKLDEVLVTATKRVTEQQTTPIAISTLQAGNIERQYGSRDIRDMANLLPNIIMENVTGFNAAAFGMRGTATIDNDPFRETAVGIVLDGVAFSDVESQLLDIFDIERIEVLRGPQGTLFGKNTTAGVISVITKKPVHNEYFGKLKATFGNVGTREFRAAVNIPLVEDKLSFRGVFGYVHDKGAFTNDKPSKFYGVAPGAPASPLVGNGRELPGTIPVVGDGGRLNGKDIYNFKAKFLFTPSDNYEVTIYGTFLRNRSDPFPGVNETPPDGMPDGIGIPRNFFFNSQGWPGIDRAAGDDPFSTGYSVRTNLPYRLTDGIRIDQNGVTVTQKLDLDRFTLTSVTAYFDYSLRTAHSFTGEAFGSLFDTLRATERRQFQQELRVNSNFDGPFNFTAGATYFSHRAQRHSVSTTGFLSIPFTFPGCFEALPIPAGCQIDPSRNLNSTYSDGEQKGDAIGIFGEASYDITQKLSVSIGVRYSYEKKKITRLSTGDFTEADHARFLANPDRLVDPLPEAPILLDIASQNSWDAFTFRGIIGYDITDDIYAYASFSQGFVSGGFSSLCTTVTACSDFGPEKADSYELGLKADLLDKRLRINLAAYWVEYDGLQRTQVIQIIDNMGNPNQETQTRNVGSLRSRGLELELTALPTPELRLSFTLTYQDADYLDFLTDFAPADSSLIALGVCMDSADCLAQGFNVDALGNDDGTLLQPNHSPKWQIGGSFTYDLVLPNAGDTIVFGGSVHWQPESEFSVFNSANTQIEERTLVNGSITYVDADERWQLSIYGRNLLNKVHRVAGQSVAGFWNWSSFGEQRRWGVELSVNL